MYNSNHVADRIKFRAKELNISMKQLLIDVDLGKNTMSNFKTSMPKADNLAKIADYLDCSVDYLLGRTDNPDSHKSKTKNIPLPPLEIAAYGAEGTEGTYTTPTEEIT